MNRAQEAIARLAGFDEVQQSIESNYEDRLTATEQEFTEKYTELAEAYEHIDSQNALLQRQIEDIDYLNLFDIGAIKDVIPIGDRKKVLNKLRRLRQENPLAKQAIRLIVRFTLGKGVELIIGPDPEKKKALPPLPMPTSGGAPQDGKNPFANNANGSSSANGNGNGKSKVSNLPNAAKEAGAGGIGSPPASPLGVSGIVDEFDPAGQDDSLKEQITEFWRDSDNQRALTSRSAMQEWVDEVAVDGEKFFVGFEGQAAPYVKLTEVPVEQIDSIIYDPDNWKKPVYYVRSWLEQVYNGQNRQYEPKNGGQPTIKHYLDYRILPEELPDLRLRIKIKAEELAPDDQRIFHSLVNPLWTKKGKRGISELYASREWFRVYKEFMEDRAAINAAATSIAYKRKIKGGPTDVARFQNKLGNINVGYESPENPTEISRLTRPTGAGIYDSNQAIDLEWMKADTGAVNAKEDGRSIITAAGAGVGMFVHYFGDGGDANLATAQAMELPMVKTFEDWQQWTEDNILQLVFWVIRVATDYENAKKQIERVAGNFPPIHGQDVVKYMTAWSQLASNVAPGNRIVKREAIKGAMTVMDIPNIDGLMAEIDAEEAQLEVQRQAQHQAMVDAMGNGLGDPNAVPGAGEKNSNGNSTTRAKLAARDGSAQGLPPDLKTIVKGKAPPSRNGPKVPNG